MRTLYKYSLLFASIGCYTWFVGSYVFVLLFLAFIICNLSKRTSIWTVCIAIISLIAGFILLKYQISSNELSLPIGYSVFAFSCISYIVDRMRVKRLNNVSLVDILCYLFFFPKMLAGPIVRFDNFQEQLSTCIRPSGIILYKAFKIIVYASFSKFCIADNLNSLIEMEVSGFNAWLTSFLFAFQLYLDFYAYSNYAIAFGLMLGIELPISFDSPYKASSFKDFWKRWNITISEWLRDYVYIPLGGGRIHGRVRKSMNVLITFLVSGIWHGASFPFLLWGGAHGFLIIIERFFINRKKNQYLLNYFYRIIVLVVAALLWQLFRLDSLIDIILFTQQLITPNPINLELLFFTIGSVFLLSVMDSKTIKQLIFSVSDSKPFIYKEVCFICLMLFAILVFHSQPNFNFFYFKF